MTAGAHMSVSRSSPPYALVSLDKKVQQRERGQPNRAVQAGEGENGSEAPLASRQMPLLAGEEGPTRGEMPPEWRDLRATRRHPPASALPSESRGPQGCATLPSRLRAAAGEPRAQRPRAAALQPPSSLRRPRRSLRCRGDEMGRDRKREGTDGWGGCSWKEISFGGGWCHTATARWRPGARGGSGRRG